MNRHQIVEAILFASDAPLTAGEISRADESLDEDCVEEAIDFLKAEYGDADRSFQIVEVAEGYQILTRAEFAPYLERFDNVPRPSRLSGPALETLAIIAYRQPLGRVEIEYIRGVSSSGVIRTLLDRQLVDVVGRGEGLGRPLLYGTTRHFLEHFGFRSLEDLPRPEELPVILRDRIPLGPPEEEAGGADQEELALEQGRPGGERAGEGPPGAGADDASEPEAARPDRAPAPPVETLLDDEASVEAPDGAADAGDAGDAGVDTAASREPAPAEIPWEEARAAEDDSADPSADGEPADEDLRN